MATEEEVLYVLAILSAAFPNFQMADQTPEVYVRLLEDIPKEVLEAGALDHISRSVFFPKVAELRKAAADIAMNKQGIPIATEAWGEATKAMRYYGRNNKPDFDNPILEKTIEALGWYDLCMSTNAVADRARFIEAYNAFIEKQSMGAVTLPEVKRLTLGLGEKSKQLTDGLAQRMSVK
jgi:hypothetical protein